LQKHFMPIYAAKYFFFLDIPQKKLMCIYARKIKKKMITPLCVLWNANHTEFSSDFFNTIFFLALDNHTDLWNSSLLAF